MVALLSALSTCSSVVQQFPAVSPDPAVAGSTKLSRQETAKMGPRPTLVICPLSVLSNWQVFILSMPLPLRENYDMQ